MPGYTWLIITAGVIAVFIAMLKLTAKSIGLNNIMKIVVLDGYTLNPGDLDWDALNKLGDVAIHDRTPYTETVSRCIGATVVLTNKAPMDAAILDQLPHLKYIGVLATGFNIVDTAVFIVRALLTHTET